MKNIPVLYFHCYYSHLLPESRLTLQSGSKLENNNKIQQKYFATNNSK